MATDDKKADREIFKSPTRKRIEDAIAKEMNSESWKSDSHKDHIAAVTRVFNLYCKRHASK